MNIEFFWSTQVDLITEYKQDVPPDFLKNLTCYMNNLTILCIIVIFFIFIDE